LCRSAVQRGAVCCSVVQRGGIPVNLLKYRNGAC